MLLRHMPFAKLPQHLPKKKALAKVRSCCHQLLFTFNTSHLFYSLLQQHLYTETGKLHVLLPRFEYKILSKKYNKGMSAHWRDKLSSVQNATAEENQKLQTTWQTMKDQGFYHLSTSYETNTSHWQQTYGTGDDDLSKRFQSLLQQMETHDKKEVNDDEDEHE